MILGAIIGAGIGILLGAIVVHFNHKDDTNFSYCSEEACPECNQKPFLHYYTMHECKCAQELKEKFYKKYYDEHPVSVSHLPANTLKTWRWEAWVSHYNKYLIKQNDVRFIDARNAYAKVRDDFFSSYLEESFEPVRILKKYFDLLDLKDGHEN